MCEVLDANSAILKPGAVGVYAAARRKLSGPAGWQGSSLVLNVTRHFSSRQQSTAGWDSSKDGRRKTIVLGKPTFKIQI